MSRYRFITGQRTQYPVGRLCAVLEVSASGFYAWLKRTPSRRAQANDTLATRIRTVHEASRRTYGYLRIHAQLQAQGERVGKLSRGAADGAPGAGEEGTAVVQGDDPA